MPSTIDGPHLNNPYDDPEHNPFTSPLSATDISAGSDNAGIASTMPTQPFRHSRSSSSSAFLEWQNGETGYTSGGGGGRRESGLHRRHTRAQTEHIASSSYHPLHSKRSAAEFDTRPSLSKAVGALVDVEEPPETAFPPVESVPEEEQQTVLVHEVWITLVLWHEPPLTPIINQIQAGDSLARIALKYKVQLSDLRRANGLWASDSLHLRKTLYIPLSIIPSSSKSPTSPQFDRAELLGTVSRRVRKAELSFFPPTSTNATTSSQVRSQSRPALSRDISVSSSPNGVPSLSSFFSVASDNIRARISLDSSREGSEEGEDSVELDEFEVDKALQRTPRVSQSSPSSPHGGVQVVASSPKPGFAPSGSWLPIRTRQLEPSPDMQLPVLKPRRLPQENGSGSQLVDFDI